MLTPLLALTLAAPCLALEPGESAPVTALEAAVDQELEGRVVVVNFWATWCGPCRVELPHLQALDERLAGDQVEVVTISVDTSERLVEALTRRIGLDLPVFVDIEGELADEFKPPAMPTTYVLAPDGTIHDVLQGGLDEPAIDALEQRLRALRSRSPMASR